jgi:hypothetical protein
VPAGLRGHRRRAGAGRRRIHGDRWARRVRRRRSASSRRLGRASRSASPGGWLGRGHRR